MKAIVWTKYGPPEGLQLQEVEKPFPKDNEVLIRIHATTVTAGDCEMRSLKLPLFLSFPTRMYVGFRRPTRVKIIGQEMAGETEAVGKDVSLFKPGDPVFGATSFGQGTYCEYICLPEGSDGTDVALAIKPANLTYEEAAAVPIGGNTALYLLRKAELRRGESVLVYGASGSVGSYAVQLARHFGAEVTGVCSTANLELVRSLGARHVLDYTRQDFIHAGKRYDVVFDAVGKISPSRSKAVLKRNGRVLSITSPTSEETENLIFLKELIEAGEIRPVIDRRYPLEQIVKAYRHVDRGHKKGNVVITVRDGSPA